MNDEEAQRMWRKKQREFDGAVNAKDNHLAAIFNARASKEDRIDALDPVFWERSGFKLRLWRFYFEFRWLKRVPRDPNNNIYLRKIDGAPWVRHASPVADFKRAWDEGDPR